MFKPKPGTQDSSRNYDLSSEESNLRGSSPKPRRSFVHEFFDGPDLEEHDDANRTTTSTPKNTGSQNFGVGYNRGRTSSRSTGADHVSPTGLGSRVNVFNDFTDTEQQKPSVMDAAMKTFGLTGNFEKEKQQEAERKLQLARHNQVLAMRKLEELQQTLQDAEQGNGFMGFITGSTWEKKQAVDVARRKVGSATAAAKLAETEYKTVMQQTGGAVHKDLLSPLDTRDYRSPLLSGATRGAEKTIMGVLQKAVIGETYPRLMFLQVIGASGLPKMDTIGWCDPYCIITNKVTKEQWKTAIIYDNPEPVWEEAFTVTVSSPQDTIEFQVYDYDRVGRDDYIGLSYLSMDSRFVNGREIALEIIDKSQTRGHLRIAAQWADEAKPTQESGKFFYRVVCPNGVRLRKLPDEHSAVTGQTLKAGEVFEASDRLKPMDENITYVRINASKDKWMRSGWVFEKLISHDQRQQLVETPILERVTAPKHVTGTFFYEVIRREGIRLHVLQSVQSRMTKDTYLCGTILEVSEKHTPLGSTTTFCRVDDSRGGFVLEDATGNIMNFWDTQGLRQCEAPRAIRTNNYGTNQSRTNNYGTNQTRRADPETQYEVVSEGGVYSRAEPALGAIQPALIKCGEVFIATEKAVQEYSPGVNHGEPITWLRRKDYNDWVRTEKCGIKLVEEVQDRIEETGGPWEYTIVYEYGCYIRRAPRMDAERLDILNCGEKISVKKKLTYARDLKAKEKTVFLQIDDGENKWIPSWTKQNGTIAIDPNSFGLENVLTNCSIPNIVSFS